MSLNTKVCNVVCRRHCMYAHDIACRMHTTLHTWKLCRYTICNFLSIICMSQIMVLKRIKKYPHGNVLCVSGTQRLVGTRDTNQYLRVLTSQSGYFYMPLKPLIWKTRFRWNLLKKIQNGVSGNQSVQCPMAGGYPRHIVSHLRPLTWQSIFLYEL